MAALVQTLQLATPQESFVTIVQGVDEPFLRFAGWPTAAVEKQVPLDAFGPLGDGMSAFLMGRSSATIQGIMVHLGLIGVDFSGQIHAMVSIPTPPLTIPKGTQIAPLVPFKSSVSRTEDRLRGDGGFGSTRPPQVCWIAVLTKDHPETLCTVSMPGAMPLEIHLHSILDTGADVSILSLAAWPPQWPLSLAKTSISGLGGMKQCYVSQNPMAIMNLEGQTAIIWPHVTEIAQNLWGRDVLAVWGVYRIEPSTDVTVFITTPDLHPTGIIGQWNDDWTDPLHILEWVFLPHQPHKMATALFELIARLIIKCRQRCLQLMGADPSKIILLVQREEFDVNNVLLQSALEGFSGQITYHLPSHKLLQVAKNTQFSLQPKNSQEPMQGPTVFTDGSGKTGKAIATWQDGSEWQVLESHEDGSAQLVELRAAVMAFEKFSQEPFNLIIVSTYVADIAQRLGCSVLKEVSNPALIHLLKALWCAVQANVHPYYVLHVRSHTNLPGFVVEVRASVGEAIILHYMDDVLVCAPNDDLLSHALDLTIDSLVAARVRASGGKDSKDATLEVPGSGDCHHRSKRMTRPQELVAELIRKARIRIRELAGCDFECIHIPIEINSGQITKAMLIHENEALQFALDSYTGQISIHQPAHKLFREQIQFKLSLKSVQSRRPLKALIIFTDASGTSHKSVITWKDPQTQQWEKGIFEVEGSPQVAELAAVVRAFEKFPEPFNLVTDLAYVAGVVSRAEQAVLSEVSNAALFNLLSTLVNLISHREQQFYVMHIRSHTDLPGFIAKGSRRADALAAPVEMAPLLNIFGQAKISHQLFHQNAPGLVRQFHLTWEQARAIVAPSPLCQQHALPALSAGANPRGLNSCEVWQTEVTHIMSFGRQRYVHVSVDTFSGVVCASDHTGEKSSDVMKHLIQAFSFLGIPKSIKTDNGPKYTSKEFRSFLQQWRAEHKTGIPYSPTGQAIVKRTHQNLKRVLNQQHQSLKLETPQIQLSKALFTLNFLNCTYENLNPPIVRHFRENCQLQLKAKPLVMVKDPATRETEGCHDLVTWVVGEKAHDVIAHWRQAFAVLGISSAVKTDNGPAYASQQGPLIFQGCQTMICSPESSLLPCVCFHPDSPLDYAEVEEGYGCVKINKNKRNGRDVDIGSGFNLHSQFDNQDALARTNRALRITRKLDQDWGQEKKIESTFASKRCYKMYKFVCVMFN
ncbi:hypothetical protein DUI87_20526 [Hirundo rustica rustica]|uniref:RNA-directed DNA polymerase n=1 Tax=Hirundo rustica rustica TaxID=333673 RepID=A0A3M0JWZ4_HIRRU|nr:hypothetical protein DUI87_20526 [Hirundo rustica rustica]